jgi:hypothetical protein
MPTTRSRIIAAIVLLFLFGLLGFAEWSANQHCRQNQNCGSYQSANRSGEGQRSDFSGWYPTSAIDRYTLLLAAFTAGLTVASVWQGIFLLRADKTAS